MPRENTRRNTRKDQKTRDTSPEIKTDGITCCVEHVRDRGRGGITFALRITEPLLVEIYNCRIVQSRDEGGEFVGMPSRRGTDGNYYRHAYLHLSDAQNADIIQLVYDELEKA